MLDKNGVETTKRTFYRLLIVKDDEHYEGKGIYFSPINGYQWNYAGNYYFLYQNNDDDDDKRKWNVVHIETGAGVSRGTSKADAVKNAKIVLEEHKGELEQRFNEIIAKYGRSPLMAPDPMSEWLKKPSPETPPNVANIP